MEYTTHLVLQSRATRLSELTCASLLPNLTGLQPSMALCMNRLRMGAIRFAAEGRFTLQTTIPLRDFGLTGSRFTRRY